MSARLRDAVRRLVLLLDTPQHVPVLSPLIERGLPIFCFKASWEIGFAARSSGLLPDKGLNKALQHLRRDFTKSFTVDELARMSHLSRATFHRQFVQRTGIVPMQYQKLLRLQEARRLMLSSVQDCLHWGPTSWVIKVFPTSLASIGDYLEHRRPGTQETSGRAMQAFMPSKSSSECATKKIGAEKRA